MEDRERLSRIRRLARRPYRFVAFCSFLLAGVCAAQALIVGLFMTPMNELEALLFYGSLALVPIALTQGMAATREKRMALDLQYLLDQAKSREPCRDAHPQTTDVVRSPHGD